MRRASLSHYAMSSCVTATLLAGCGGGGESATPSAYQAVQALTQSRTFKYTGKEQSFVVPSGVTRITVVARGAGGDSCAGTGRGARAYAVIPVTPKERLDIYVGGAGTGRQFARRMRSASTGGFNGGGASGGYTGGGGGASDVRVSPGRLRDRILVAAGGGGAGGTYNDCNYSTFEGAGGGGGGLTGGNGQSGFGSATANGPRGKARFDSGYGSGNGGDGGTQSQGGAGGSGGYGSDCKEPGNPGAAGALGLGGGGGLVIPSHDSYFSDGGGGGGGGYFGGGGGGGSCSADANFGGGGGGGGSSYAEPRATHVKYWGNWKNASGNGLVVFSW
jgi:hypothetical protein